VNQVFLTENLILKFSSVSNCVSDEFYVESYIVLVFVQLQSSRNFCIDIVLLIIILGIAAYLYK